MSPKRMAGQTFYKTNKFEFGQKQDQAEKHQIYNEKDLINTGTGYKMPPRFLWIPSNHLIRVAIVRICFIKDMEQFLEDNMKVK